MRVDTAVEGRKVPSQYIADQVLAADRAPRNAHERGQKIEFHGGEIHRRAATPHGASSPIKLDIPNGDRGRDRPLRRRSSQDGADARHQLGGIERLRQIIVRANLKASNAVVRIASSRQHQHGGAGVLSDTA